jgi:lipopolysaccharide/colanic/teichoic acid biosynthesis glycosyltransferase
MIAMDIQYSKTLSFRGDLAILLKTIPVILSQIEQSQKPREHRPMNSETLRTIPLKQS